MTNRSSIGNFLPLLTALLTSILLSSDACLIPQAPLHNPTNNLKQTADTILPDEHSNTISTHLGSFRPFLEWGNLSSRQFRLELLSSKPKLEKSPSAEKSSGILGTKFIYHSVMLTWDTPLSSQSPWAPVNGQHCFCLTLRAGCVQEIPKARGLWGWINP